MSAPLSFRHTAFGQRAGAMKPALLAGALVVVLLSVLAWSHLMPSGTMLILRGIAAEHAPKGQLDDDAAVEYARRAGFRAQVLDVAGGTGEQMTMTLETLRTNPRVHALYGFSGGAYTLAKLWHELSAEEKARMRRIVVVGAPGVGEESFPGAAKVVVQPDPPEGHMQAPRALLQRAE